MSVVNYKKLNSYFTFGVIVLFIFAWFFAFSKTFDAIQINKSLRAKNADNIDLSSNPAHLLRTKKELNQYLKEYIVDSANWSQEFWLKSSEIAGKRNINVAFNQNEKSNSDTSNVVITQEIQFSGAFKELIQLLDTLERIDNLGRINSLKFYKEKPTGGSSSENVKLNIRIGGIHGSSVNVVEY